MTEMAAGALMFLQFDVKPARQTVERTYSREQVLDAGLLPAGLRPGSEQPYFTPGFPLALPLEHEVRIKSFDGPPTAKFTAAEGDPILSDTKELAWYTSDAQDGAGDGGDGPHPGPDRFHQSEPQDAARISAPTSPITSPPSCWPPWMTSRWRVPIRCCLPPARAWPTPIRNGTTPIAGSAVAARAIRPRSSSR